jgi:PelA/Pel-15E family pectate lyase
MKFHGLILFALLFCPLLVRATVIGTNVPAQPLTAARVAALPAWKTYLENSRRQGQADQDFLHAEMKASKMTNAIAPPKSASPKGTPLDRPAVWYGGDEARRIAENVSTFQTPAGGWSKHTDFAQHRRAPGELFAADSTSSFLTTNDFDRSPRVNWSYIGTFDNGATITELRFLAMVIHAGKTNDFELQKTFGRELEKSFARGLDYIFTAQFPNGGWPQVYPLQGGYHDAVTFNDDAMLNVIKFLRDVSLGEEEFSFVPSELRARADASWRRGLDCILAAQVVVEGRRTVWGQQHDALTLQPVSARNYEMPSLASSESATLVLFMMQLPKPDSNVVAAVHAAAAWFEKTKIMGKAFQVVGTESRKLVDAPGAGPIWARYYEVGSDQPIYGDRDKSIHDDVNEISRERRKGYGWFKDSAKRVAQHYAKWAKAHPLK